MNISEQFYNAVRDAAAKGIDTAWEAEIAPLAQQLIGSLVQDLTRTSRLVDVVRDATYKAIDARVAHHLATTYAPEIDAMAQEKARRHIEKRRKAMALPTGDPLL